MQDTLIREEEQLQQKEGAPSEMKTQNVKGNNLTTAFRVAQPESVQRILGILKKTRIFGEFWKGNESEDTATINNKT